MPHERKRHLTALLNQTLAFSPLVGILGHRQVGKTTLLEQISDSYSTLDDDHTLTHAREYPTEFIAKRTSLRSAIDECQLEPRLFPALKERVRKDRRPGQFILSGSVRFTSKKLIRESLTGRIMNLELLPMTLSELDQQDVPNFLVTILEQKKIPEDLNRPLKAKEFERRSKIIEHYLERGGLPGVCFIRDERLRGQKILDQLETILNRDLRQVQNTSLTFQEILSFLRALALIDGGIINYEALRKVSSISAVTQKKLLFALESVFIIRTLAIEGDSRSRTLFFEDQAEVRTLAQHRLSPDQEWSGLILRNLREQIFYTQGLNATFFQYRTRAGVRVPFAVRTPESTVGVIPILGELSRAQKAAGQSFLRKYGNAQIIWVTDRNIATQIDDRSAVLSAAKILF